MNDNNDLEIMPPSAVASLERAAIDCQVATAHAYPRSLEQFKKRATGMATLDLETAESCIYSRPVGNGKIAEGASIRMAEIVAASYGNLRVASRIIEQTPRYVKCEGVAHDLESNYAGKSECVEPTVTRGGDPYSEGQRAVVAKACLSKAYRDAVFKVVPKAMCKTIINAAKGVINKEVATIEQRQKRAKDWLKQIKVDEARAFAALGVKGWSEITDDHLTTLTGLKTAISEQDVTLEEAFPQVAKAPSFGPTGTTPPPATAKSAEQPRKNVTDASGATSSPSEPNGASKAAPAATGEAQQGESERTEPESGGARQETGTATGTFVPRSGESEELSNLRYLMFQSSITEERVVAYCRQNKLLRDNQNAISDLATGKLTQLAKAWTTVAPLIAKG